MLPKAFQDPEKIVVATDMAISQKLLENEFATDLCDSTLSGLSLEECGTIVRFADGKTVPTTQDFLEDIARLIGMPLAFAYDVEFSLFKTIFDARKIQLDQKVRGCLVRGRAVGLATSAYRPLRSRDLLDKIQSLGSFFWKLHRATFADRTVQLDFLSQDPIIHPQVGDEIRCGVRISNSETNGAAAKGWLFTHRLICKNGAVMANQLGTARWNYDNRVTYDASVAKFIDAFLNLNSTQGRLAGLYAKAVDLPIAEEGLLRVHRRVSIATGVSAENVDDLLSIPTEQRRRIQATVRKRHAMGLPEAPSSYRLYAVHNQITGAARRLAPRLRSRLEEIGGDVLSLSGLN